MQIEDKQNLMNLPKELLQKIVMGLCELNIDYILFNNICTYELIYYSTVYFKIKNINFEIKEKFIWKSFVSKNDEYNYYIHQIDKFISDIKSNCDSTLDFTYDRPGGMLKFLDQNCEYDLEENNKLMLYRNREPINSYQRFSLEFIKDKITINGKIIIYNCKDCIIKLLEFIKYMSFAPCNHLYLNNIDNITDVNKKYNLFDRLKFKLQMFNGFKEIPLDLYYNLYNICKSISDDKNKYYPLYYTDEFWLIKLIENLNNSRLGLKFENNCKYETYYMLLKVDTGFEINFVPNIIFNFIKKSDRSIS